MEPIDFIQIFAVSAFIFYLLLFSYDNFSYRRGNRFEEMFLTLVLMLIGSSCIMFVFNIVRSF